MRKFANILPTRNEAPNRISKTVNSNVLLVCHVAMAPNAPRTRAIFQDVWMLMSAKMIRIESEAQRQIPHPQSAIYVRWMIMESLCVAAPLPARALREGGLTSRAQNTAYSPRMAKPCAVVRHKRMSNLCRALNVWCKLFRTSLRASNSHGRLLRIQNGGNAT